MEDSGSDVRDAARKKITDQTFLAILAMWEKPELTRQVTDQALLADIAVEAWDWKVREAAVLKLTDQATLARIAVEDKQSDVRDAAVLKLTDQATLAKIAVEYWRYGSDVREETHCQATLEDRCGRMRMSAKPPYQTQTRLSL